MSEIPFENLNLDSKAKIVWEEGVFLESLQYYNCQINLYSWNKKFVEVFYHPANDEIERISIATDEDMKKYVSRIDIKDL